MIRSELFAFEQLRLTMEHLTGKEKTMTPLQSYQEWVADGSFDPFAGKQNTEELMYIQMGISGEAGEFTEGIK